MTDNELLVALTTLFDKKLKPIEQRLTSVNMILEQDILPRLQNLESCYTSTYRRYVAAADHSDAIQEDVELMKKVITKHSEILQTIS